MAKTEKHKCCEKVHNEYSVTFRPCSKWANVQIGGKWYCGSHNPEKVKARATARDAKFDAKYAKKEKVWALEAAAPDLLAACKEIVDYYQKMSGNENCPVADKYWIKGAIMARAAIAKAEGRSI